MTTAGWIVSIVFLLVGLVAGYFAGAGARTAPASDQAAQRDALAHQIATELVPLNQALSTLDTKVAKMDTAQKGQMSWMIQRLQDAQQMDREILSATQGLDTALRQSPKRGTWGEVSLRRVLEMSGLTRHIDFAEQVRVNSGSSRPDVVVHLPGKAALVIDAKVPLDAYLRSFDDEGDPNMEMAKHVRAVRNHVNQLANRKYSDVVEGSLDAVIMFMPSEALVSASFDADPGLFEESLEKGIIIAGPSTLHALLQSIGHVWAQQSLEQDAQELLSLGRSLVDRINVLGGHLTKLGESLRQTVANYNRAIGSFEQRLAVSARQINSFERSVKPAPDPLEDSIRMPTQEGE